MTDLDPDEFRRLGHAVVDWVAAYRAGAAGPAGAPRRRPRSGPRRAARPAPRAPAAARHAARRRSTASSPPPPWHGSTPASSATSPPTPRSPRCSATSSRAGWAARGCSGRPPPRAPRSSRPCSTASRARSGSTPAFTFAGGGGGTIAGLGVVGRARRAARGAAPQLARRGAAGGATRASTAASASTSPPRRTRRWPRPRGSRAWARRALRVVGSSPGEFAMSPDALAALLREDVAAGLRPGAGVPDRRHHRHRRGRPGPRDRRGRPRARRVGARRRRLGRGRGALPRAPRPARRRRARRLVLHRRPQVAAHGVRRLAAVGARRDGAARRAVDHPGVPAQRRERLGRGGRLPRLAGLAGPPLPGAEAVDGAAHARARGPAHATSAATSRWPPSWPGGSRPSPASPWPRRPRSRWCACAATPATRMPTTAPPARCWTPVNASGRGVPDATRSWTAATPSGWRSAG